MSQRSPRGSGTDDVLAELMESLKNKIGDKGGFAGSLGDFMEMMESVVGEAFRRKKAAVLRREITENPYSWRYLSFADSDHFIGGVITQAHGLIDASVRLKVLNIFPDMSAEDADVRIFEVRQGTLPAEEYRNRLLTKEEVIKIWPDATVAGKDEEPAPPPQRETRHVLFEGPSQNIREVAKDVAHARQQVEAQDTDG